MKNVIRNTLALFLLASNSLYAATTNFVLTDVVAFNPFTTQPPAGGVSIIGNPPYFDAAGSATVDDNGSVLISISALELDGRHPSEFTYDSSPDGWVTSVGGDSVIKSPNAICNATTVTVSPCHSVSTLIDFVGDWHTGIDNAGVPNSVFDVEVTLENQVLTLTRTVPFGIPGTTAGGYFVFRTVVPLPPAIYLLGSALAVVGISRRRRMHTPS